MAKIASIYFFLGFNQAVTLNRIIHKVNELLGKNLRPTHATRPPGNVKHAIADIAATENLINFKLTVPFRECLLLAINW